MLLKYKADTSARDKNWQTPLHLAAANNALKCAEALLAVSPTVNISDRTGRVALHHAAYILFHITVSTLLYNFIPKHLFYLLATKAMGVTVIWLNC